VSQAGSVAATEAVGEAGLLERTRSSVFRTRADRVLPVCAAGDSASDLKTRAPLVAARTPAPLFFMPKNLKAPSDRDNLPPSRPRPLILPSQD